MVAGPEHRGSPAGVRAPLGPRGEEGEREQIEQNYCGDVAAGEKRLETADVPLCRRLSLPSSYHLDEDEDASRRAIPGRAFPLPLRPQTTRATTSTPAGALPAPPRPLPPLHPPGHADEEPAPPARARPRLAPH
ncbi:unnamed protein product [Boreogadus saida]